MTASAGRHATLAPAAAALAAAVLLIAPSSANADDSEGASADAPSVAPAGMTPPAAAASFLPKKDLIRTEKAQAPDVEEPHRDWHQHLDRLIGRAPEPLINIYNTWTHETLALPVKANPTLDEQTIDRFLRCHFTNEPTDMDSQLLGVVVKAARHFRVRRVEIISGFRAPKYNLILRKKGREVARESQHTLGKAVDFRLPGIATQTLHRWAQRLKLGGVGFYRHSGFVHVDTGRVRYWTGN